MSYFYAQEHVQLQAPRGVGQPRQQITTGITNGRDPRIESEIEKMGNQPNVWNGLMDARKAARNPQGIRVMQAPGYTGDNVIYEPAPKKVLPRIRPGMSDEDLRSIWHEDERKAIAQSKMAKGPNYVERMNDHGTSPVNQHQEPHRQAVRVLPKPVVDGSADVEPMGLKGVGQHCAGQPKYYGRRAPTEADFALPKFEAKPRTVGIRMAAKPKDTIQIG